MRISGTQTTHSADRHTAKAKPEVSPVVARLFFIQSSYKKSTGELTIFHLLGGSSLFRKRDRKRCVFAFHFSAVEVHFVGQQVPDYLRHLSGRGDDRFAAALIFLHMFVTLHEPPCRCVSATPDSQNKLDKRSAQLLGTALRYLSMMH